MSRKPRPVAAYGVVRHDNGSLCALSFTKTYPDGMKGAGRLVRLVEADPNPPTKRMVDARSALLDTATEVASIIGAADPALYTTQPISLELSALYAANDEWQEAQLRGATV